MHYRGYLLRYSGGQVEIWQGEVIIDRQPSRAEAEALIDQWMVADDGR